MARISRLVVPGYPHHVSQRGKAATKHSEPEKLAAKNARYAKEEIGLSPAKTQRRKGGI